MSSEILSIHNGILKRLADSAHVSEDERRDIHAALADVHESLSEGKPLVDRETEQRNIRRAELQRQLAELDT